VYIRKYATSPGEGGISAISTCREKYEKGEILKVESGQIKGKMDL
jgi:hypothetical protein